MDPVNLINYSQPNVPEELSLTLPAPAASRVSNDDAHTLLFGIMVKIYTFCQENPQEIKGEAWITYDTDLSKKRVHVQTSKGEIKKLNQVRVTSYNIDQKCASLKWEFDIGENRDRETYTTGRAELDIPNMLLNGLEYERSFPSEVPLPLPRKEFWDVWETELPQQVQHYQTNIYPQIVQTIKKICKLNPALRLDIIDLGGGSGNLAETILKSLSNSVRKIVVIDSSAKLIEKAKERATKYPDSLIPRHLSIEEISEKLYDSQEYAQSAHVIILCGVIAHQVLTKEVGLDIVAKCQSILRENGIIIAASLSPALINSTEYQQMGYQVLNKSFSFLLNKGSPDASWTTNDFYILQKKPSNS